MKREDIIKQAQEAGAKIHDTSEGWGVLVMTREELVRFGQRVAAKAAAAEREACAQIALEFNTEGVDDIAAAIRARGDHAQEE